MSSSLLLRVPAVHGERFPLLLGLAAAMVGIAWGDLPPPLLEDNMDRAAASVPPRTAVAAKISSGCGKAPRDKQGKLQRRTITVPDALAEGGMLSREYAIYIPITYDENKPAKLLTYFHGWGSNWWTESEGTGWGKLKFNKLSESKNYVVVYPKGEDDYQGSGSWTSWNVGGNGMQSTCVKKTEGYCYQSCRKAGKCTGCEWTTCYDDVTFTEEVLEEVENAYCIDTTDRFATGESTGGIFIYHFVAERPGIFTGLMPIFGLPLEGLLVVPQQLANDWILHYHGINDKQVPIDGGISSDGWIYTGVDETLGVWTGIQRCSSANPVAVKTPFDGGAHSIACLEYPKCTGRILKCTYRGSHGTWPAESEQLAYWFFDQKDGQRDGGNAKHFALSP